MYDGSTSGISASAGAWNGSPPRFAINSTICWPSRLSRTATFLARMKRVALPAPHAGKYMRPINTRSTSSTTPIPRLQPISFFSTGSSGSSAIFCISSPTFNSFAMAYSSRSTGRQRGLDADEKDERDDQTHPDHEPEQAQHINGRQPADALFPKLLEVSHHADREERHHEEDAAEGIGFTHRGLDLARELWRRAERQGENHHESEDIADDEFGEAFPDLHDPCLVAFPHVDVGRPDVGEDERPDTDEDVDEDLNCRGGAEQPAFLIVDAF